MYLTCKYCGARNVKTIGGDNGDPFDRRPPKTVCGDCGRVLAEGEDVFDTLYKETLRQMSEEDKNQ